eukprot:CAMPEP_0174286070 /NCGR_PEP_ID=MMETSP0809-20121228/10603_1 /TAXON_ID=73025 ORGANISM="Eutreptiella gymnastica-like, Strain CCMP1594" /NCGR_SAMPLE_ID=MMETSP0809 /ASSEMBLY_ACC=CAM_ASM_000658 /LENGTH=270 /DNA_ID=CAMNT_0015382005 /DNA_START=25 /DNA_END=837 /DNA_ORIENTATION=+
MAGSKDKGPVHPAKKFFLVAAVLLLVAFALSVAAIFTPWSMKFPSITARYSYGLWYNCYWDPTSTTNLRQCQGNVYEVGSGTSFIPVFSDTTARGYFHATQAFACAGAGWSFFSVLVLLMCASKIWSRPMGLAAYAVCMVFFAWAIIMMAWIMYLVYAEYPVWGQLPGFPWNTSVGTFTNGSSPLRGYSWGFILTVVAAFFALLSTVVTCAGLNKLRTWYPVQEPIAPVPEYPVVPQYPMVHEPAYYAETPQPLMPTYPTFDNPMSTYYY